MLKKGPDPNRINGSGPKSAKDGCEEWKELNSISQDI
jgi:hypothetical protein